MQITCLHAVRRLTKVGRAPDERGLIPEPNKTVPDPVHGSSLDQATRPRGARPTATHHHDYRQRTPQAAHGHCRARNDMAATQRRYRR